MEVKTFPYAVIWGGKIVPPHTPIEVSEVGISKEETTISKKETVAENATVAEEITVAEKPKKGAKKNDKRGIDKA